MTAPAAILANRPDGSQYVFDWKAANGDWEKQYGDATLHIVRNATTGAFTMSSADDTAEIYSANGFIQSAVDEHGIGWTFTYSGTYLQTVTHTSGRSVGFTWTGNKVTSVRDPAGSSYTYSYNSHGMLAGVTYPNSPADTVTYLYENTSYPVALTGIVVNGVRYSTYAYSTSYPTKIATDGLGTGSIEGLSFAYSADDLQTTVTNSRNAVATYQYQMINGQKLLISKTQSGVTGTTFSTPATTTYDSVTGLMTKQVDFNGNETDTQYDSLRRLLTMTTGISTTDPHDTRTTINTWDGQRSRLLTVKVYGDSLTANPVSQTDYTYYASTDPAKNQLKSVVVTDLTGVAGSGGTRTTNYSYQMYANGMVKQKVVSLVLPGSSTMNTTFNYDALGNLTSVVDALSHSAALLNFTGLGQPQTLTDANGFSTTLIYDARGRATQSTRVISGTAQSTTTTYDGLNNPLKIVYPDNSLAVRTYDAAGRLSTETNRVFDPTEAEKWYKVYTYDTLSDVTEVEVDSVQQKLPMCNNPNSIVASGTSAQTMSVQPQQQICYPAGTYSTTQTYTAYSSYDEIGRLTKKFGGTYSLSYTRDPNGNVLTIKDFNNNVTNNTYNAHNELRTVHDPYNVASTIYDYDAAGNLSYVMDPKGSITHYTFDGFGDKVSQQSNDTGLTTYTYDVGGRLRTLSRGSGALVTSYTPDVLGRNVSVSSGANAQSFTYDSCTYGIGRMCASSDSGGTAAYAYDAPGRLISQTATIAGTAYPTSYAYDALDRQTAVTYPDGNQVRYTYNLLGESSGVSAVIGGVSQSVAGLVTHQRLGPITGLTYGNGLAKTWTYDIDRNLKSQAITNVQSEYYGYDNNSRVSSITNFIDSNMSQTLGYDVLNRLNSVTAGVGNQGFSFDETGTRASATAGAASDTYQPDTGSNHLLGITGSHARTYGAYDALGNESSESGWRGSYSYGYDGFNRLLSVTSGSNVTTYGYDAFNRRLRKTGPGGNYSYVYGASGSLLAETSSNSTSIGTDYVWFEGKPIALIRAGALYAIHNDQLGRPYAITDASKTIVWKAQNLAFDRNVIVNTMGGLNLGFPGQYYDAESGLWYNGNRYYDSTTGRYIQSDPIGLVGGLNTYSYALNNPITSIDGSGLLGHASGAVGGQRGAPQPSAGAAVVTITLGIGTIVLIAANPEVPILVLALNSFNSANGVLEVVTTTEALTEEAVIYSVPSLTPIIETPEAMSAIEQLGEVESKLTEEATENFQKAPLGGGMCSAN